MDTSTSSPESTRLVGGYHPGKREMLDIMFYGFWYPRKFISLLRHVFLPNLFPRFFSRPDLLQVGVAAPNAQVEEYNSRKTIQLKDLMQVEKRPIVLIFGSYT